MLVASLQYETKQVSILRLLKIFLIITSETSEKLKQNKMRTKQHTECPNCWGYQTYENSNIEQENINNYQQ